MAISYGSDDRMKGNDVCVVANDVEDASSQPVCAGHEPRIASVPSPQDGHVHVGGAVHPITSIDHGHQPHGIFDSGHRNLS